MRNFFREGLILLSPKYPSQCKCFVRVVIVRPAESLKMVRVTPVCALGIQLYVLNLAISSPVQR